MLVEPEEQVDRSGRNERKGVPGGGNSMGKARERTVGGCVRSVY